MRKLLLIGALLALWISPASALAGLSQGQVNTDWLRQGISPAPKVEELGCHGAVCQARICDFWLSVKGQPSPPTWAYTRTRVVGDRVTPISATITFQRCHIHRRHS